MVLARELTPALLDLFGGSVVADVEHTVWVAAKGGSRHNLEATTTPGAFRANRRCPRPGRGVS
jgi:hypothetical protein